MSSSLQDGSTTSELLERQGRDSVEPRSRWIDRFKRVDGPWSWIMSCLLLISILVPYGCASTYGILFPNIMRDMKSTRAITAIPGSVAIANTMLYGPLYGRLCDYFGSRKVTFVGSILIAIGLVTSSYAPNIGLLIFTFAFVLGCGVGFLYFSTIVAVPLYFDKYKFEATSIICIGPGSSLLIMSPIVQQLNKSLDWRRSLLVMTAFALIPFVVSLLMRSGTLEEAEDVEEHQEQRKCTCRLEDVLYLSGFKIKMYSLVTCLTTIASTGHSMSLVHLAKFSEDIGIESDRSSWFFFTVGVSSTLSRCLVGKFGQSGFISLPNIFLLGALVLSVANFILPSTSGHTSLIIYCVAYGVGEGLIYTALINICLNCIPMAKRGIGFGMYQMINSLGYVAGPILSGYIADVTGSYNNSFYTAGGLEASAACISTLSYFLKPTKDERKTRELILDNDPMVYERETVL